MSTSFLLTAAGDLGFFSATQLEPWKAMGSDFLPEKSGHNHHFNGCKSKLLRMSVKLTSCFFTQDHGFIFLQLSDEYCI
jgi:hypothetical protein